MSTDDTQLMPLLNAVAAGDRVAMAAIYDLLAPRVLATVRPLLDENGDEDAVERVVVEAFSRVWRQAPPMIEKHPRVAAWVLALAVQCAMQDRCCLLGRIEGRLRPTSRWERLAGGDPSDDHR